MRPPSSAPRRRMVAAVLAAGVAVLGLAIWVVVVPYPSAPARSGGPLGALDCDGDIEWGSTKQAEDLRQRHDELCAEPRRERRNTALLIGGVVVVAAAAISTWPSRRLTGEALGPSGT